MTEYTLDELLNNIGELHRGIIDDKNDEIAKLKRENERLDSVLDEVDALVNDAAHTKEKDND